MFEGVREPHFSANLTTVPTCNFEDAQALILAARKGNSDANDQAHSKWHFARVQPFRQTL